jgi:hypothetical protein
MITLNNQPYPSEVRSSQAVQLETQDKPAGSSQFPGLSEELSLGREIVAGQTLETGAFPADLDGVKGNLFASHNEGEEYDGSLSDPAGSGAPINRPSTHTPKLQAENLPLTPAEEACALALLAELGRDHPKARVLRFVRYPDDRRVVLVFTDGSDEMQLQEQYE